MFILTLIFYPILYYTTSWLLRRFVCVSTVKRIRKESFIFLSRNYFVTLNIAKEKWLPTTRTEKRIFFKMFYLDKSFKVCWFYQMLLQKRVSRGCYWTHVRYVLLKRYNFKRIYGFGVDCFGVKEMRPISILCSYHWLVGYIPFSTIEFSVVQVGSTYDGNALNNIDSSILIDWICMRANCWT